MPLFQQVRFSNFFPGEFNSPNMSLNNFRFLSFVFVFAVLLFGLNENLSAQKVKIRSKITPTTCTTSSSLKFADIYADGNLAVMGSYQCRGAFIFNVSNPDAPTVLAHYNPGNNIQFLEAIVVGNTGYFGSGNSNGVHIVDLSVPSSPQLLGIVNVANGNGFSSIHEMMVFEQNGQTILLINSNSTSNKILKFINVTNPAQPVHIRDLNPTEPQWVHAMHIRGNRLFTSGWGNSSNRGRTEIYDISNIATQAPTLLGYIDDQSSVTAGNNMHSSWTSEDGNYLYSAREITNSNGPNPGDVRVYNITNPAQPVLVNSLKMVDLGLNAVTPHNPVVMGNKLYVSWYQAGIQVFDISNPAEPKRIGQYDTYSPTFAPEENAGSLTDEPWDLVCGSENLQNALPTTYDGNWAVFPFLGEDKVLAGDLTGGLFILDASAANAPLKNRVSDFDGDGKTDYSVFTPATGIWQVEQSSDNSQSQTGFGLSGDKIVTGDYDGDGKADMAIFRPSTGTWWIRRSSDPNNFMAVQFGLSTDIPVAADYDADGRTDIAVFRPSNGVWYIQQSTLGLRIVQWGTNGDKPVTGDFEGDGKADLTVYRPGTGVWYVMKSSSSQWYAIQFGVSTDKPLSADFDGDGRNDIAVYRPSTGVWYIIKSGDNSILALQFGVAEDMPIPSDFDGDGEADIAVFRPSSNVWYRLDSSNGAVNIRAFGGGGDIPSPTSVQP